MGKKRKVTIGYKYFFGIHAGLARGPLDEIVEIRVGDKTAWSGSARGNTEIRIDQPNLFGGEEKEGGIQGTLAVLMGARDQPVHARLAAMLGGIVPAFRGVATTFYDGLISAMSAYPKPWSYRVRRVLQGWENDAAWYPECAAIPMAGGAVAAMNPAHILYQVLTDTRMGRGLPSRYLDAAAWRAAADTLKAEGFGLCLKWSRQDSVETFAQTIIDHIGAALYTDRNTGLLVLKLIRAVDNVAALPIFTADTGLLAIDDDESGAQTRGVSEVIVKYRDPISKEEKSVRVKNPAAIHSAGGAVSTTTKEYPGIPTSGLALRVAQRDLQASSGFLKRFRVKLDRRGGNIVPGGVFRIAAQERGIESIALRAGRCEYGTTTDGTITITAVQDVFSLPATSYVAPDAGAHVPPETAPKPITRQRLIEAPYREIAQALGSAEAQAKDPLVGILIALATPPSPLSQSFDLVTRVGGAPYTKRADGAFCPVATLTAGIAQGATGLTVSNGWGLESVRIGQAALIDDEIVRIDAIDPATGALTVGRGCADTVPAAHASGATIWFYDDFGGSDPTEYVSSVTVNAKLLTRTPAGVLSESAAASQSLTMRGRAGRPYPPGQLRINGQFWPATITGELTVSWAHRNRLIQADQLIDTQAGSVTPEDGVRYRLRIYGNGALRRTVNDLSVTDYTYTAALEKSDGGPFSRLSVSLAAIKNGTESWASQSWEFRR